MKNKLGLGLDRVGGTFIPSVSTPATMFSGDDFFWINTNRSPVTLDGSGNIELIENLGNFGGDMQQTTEANRPGYGITTLNGKDVMDLDGVSEFLESTLPAGDWSFLHDGTLYTVLTVFKPGNVADPDSFYMLMSTGRGVGNQFFQLFFDDRSSNGFDNVFGQFIRNSNGNNVVNNRSDNGYTPANSWHHGEIRAEPGNTTAANRSIITADDQGEEKNNSETSSPTTGAPFHTLNIGVSDDQFQLAGQFAETVIVKGRIITANELSKWGNYVQSEWGI